MAVTMVVEHLLKKDASQNFWVRVQVLDAKKIKERCYGCDGWMIEKDGKFFTVQFIDTIGYAMKDAYLLYPGPVPLSNFKYMLSRKLYS
jgi:hypothetical protein